MKIRNMKRGFVVILSFWVIMSFFLPAGHYLAISSVYAQDERSLFPDVPADHWASEMITSAVDAGIVQGYPDGSFKPDYLVTEAEFLTMLFRAYGITFEVMPDVSAHYLHWADPVYQKAYEWNWPVEAYGHRRDEFMDRNRAAEVIAAADGRNLRGLYAIQYVLNQGYAKGMNENETSFASYNGDQYMTRAEAIAFIYQIKEQGMQTLKSAPQDPTDYSILQELKDSKFPSGTETEKVLYELLLDYPGYYAMNVRKDAYVIYYNGQQQFQILDNSMQLTHLNQYRQFELARDLLLAEEFKVPDDASDQLASSMETGNSLQWRTPDVVFTITPDTDNKTMFIQWIDVETFSRDEMGLHRIENQQNVLEVNEDWIEFGWVQDIYKDKNGQYYSAPSNQALLELLSAAYGDYEVKKDEWTDYSGRMVNQPEDVCTTDYVSCETVKVNDQEFRQYVFYTPDRSSSYVVRAEGEQTIGLRYGLVPLEDFFEQLDIHYEIEETSGINGTTQLLIWHLTNA